MTPTSFVRSFKQTVKLSATLPGGGCLYKIDLDSPKLAAAFPKETRGNYRLFVSGEYGSREGGNPTVFNLSYFMGGEWYLYNAGGGLSSAVGVNIIAVPLEIEHDEYAEAYFTHIATAENTMQQPGDDFSRAEDRYLTYLDHPRLYEDMDESHELMLIVSRFIDSSAAYERGNVLSDPMPDPHHYAVWFDDVKCKWAIVYPSRYSIEPGTRFHVMAMKEYYAPTPGAPYKRQTAFAFDHAAMSANQLNTNENTTLLDKEKAEHLLREINRNESLNIASTDLVVVITERLGPEGVLITKPDASGLPVKRLKNVSEINHSPLNVWYIPEGWKNGETLPRENKLWSVYVNENAPIKQILVNVCTRLECPPYCGQ